MAWQTIKQQVVDPQKVSKNEVRQQVQMYLTVGETMCKDIIRGIREEGKEPQQVRKAFRESLQEAQAVYQQDGDGKRLAMKKTMIAIALGSVDLAER